MNNDQYRNIDRVNVGSGPDCLMPGKWSNVDIRDFPGVDFVMDVTKKWPFKNLAYIYGEHFIEHLMIDQALQFLKCAGKSLRAKGKIRLSTPNLSWVIASHFNLNSNSSEETVNDTLRTNRAFHGWGHHFLWSEQMLRFVLESMHFIDVEFFSYGISNDPELKNLERHSGYCHFMGFPSVLIVEASRGNDEIRIEPAMNKMLFEEYSRHVLSGH
ncbi:MAG: hypothetical protein P9M03_10210 [Candidatus Theseobacter exili]|nr:hypothetical protein [Candidatus Theseobacter exili]